MSGLLEAAWIVMVCGELWFVLVFLLWFGMFGPLCRVGDILERRVGHWWWSRTAWAVPGVGVLISSLLAFTAVRNSLC